ncbi:ATP-binding protein [Actinocrinis puniceicyclus]|uniref:ATP-binding protein n=1 Tax=Actinocrinis puniceicyclus TaxID=977794 RepID=A0A8J7WLV3_9ACTN|nr:TniB family NTP-binding protein [Actinocrinis puniceicyclus]MBS2964768.1 ATP-binding protein [Actinocrinis puniceicyclus]
MADDILAAYNVARRVWHANLGPIRTPQLDEVHEDMWDIVDSNQQDGEKAKGGIALDALAGLGKTTTALAFAMAFHRREIAEKGELTRAGQERHPVCRISLNGNTGMRDLNRALMEFFAHPGSRRGTAADFQHRALDSALSCECRLLVLDELHFLKRSKTNRAEVSNQLKTIANDFPVTLVVIGIDLASLGLLGDIGSGNPALDQTARRTTLLTMKPFTVKTAQGRRQWRNMLLAIEKRVVLADTFPGMIADELSDYLFARTTGHIGSLMTLINRGCQRAIRTGAERLDRELMDRVKNDAGAEKARKELEAALETGRMTTRIAPGRARKQ